MKHTLTSIRRLLRQAATVYPDRESFNNAITDIAPVIGNGSFRFGADFGDYVVKLRHIDNRHNDNFGMVHIDSSNKTERKEWLKLSKRLPAVAQFVAMPIYVKLPNGHDAVIMKRYEVCELLEKNGEKYYSDIPFGKFSDTMKEQLRFVRTVFTDGHDGNVGWDFKTQRVYLIDFNFSGTGGGWIPCIETEAKRILKIAA
jgi:hypothetical protein